MNGLRKLSTFHVFNFFYVYVSCSYIVSDFIYARKANEIHARTHVKFTQQWKLINLKGPITWGGLARLAGLARFARISARLWNTLKINFAITWENFSPASWDPCIGIPGSRLAAMKIYHVIANAGLAGPTLSRH